MTIEATGDTAPALRLTWAAKSLVLAGGCAVSFAMIAVVPVLAKIQEAIAHGPEDAVLVKMLVGVVAAAVVIGTALTGFLSDRIGLKPIFVANFLMLTVAGLAGLFIDDLRTLIVARFFTGLAGGGAVTASVVLINRLPAGMRSTWMGAYVGVAMLVGIVLRPLTGLLGEHDWHLVFLIFATGVPFVVIAALWFEEIPRATGAAAAVTPISAGAGAGAAGAGPLAMLRWFPWRYLLVAFLTGIIMFVPSIYLPFLVHGMGVTSPTMISLVLLGGTATAGFSALLYGRVRKHVGEAAIFPVTFGIGFVGLALTVLAPNTLMVAGAQAILGIAVGWFTPNLLLAVGARVSADRQGRTAGIIKATIYLAAPLGVYIVEPVNAAYGARGVIGFTTLIAALLLAAFATAWIAGRARAAPAAAGA